MVVLDNMKKQINLLSRSVAFQSQEKVIRTIHTASLIIVLLTFVVTLATTIYILQIQNKLKNAYTTKSILLKDIASYSDIESKIYTLYPQIALIKQNKAGIDMSFLITSTFEMFPSSLSETDVQDISFDINGKKINMRIMFDSYDKVIALIKTLENYKNKEVFSGFILKNLQMNQKDDFSASLTLESKIK